MKTRRLMLLCALLALLALLAGLAAPAAQATTPFPIDYYDLVLDKDEELIERGDFVMASLYYTRFYPSVECKGPFTINWYYRNGDTSPWTLKGSVTKTDPDGLVHFDHRILATYDYDQVKFEIIYLPGTPNEIIRSKAILLYRPVGCSLQVPTGGTPAGEPLTARVSNAGGVPPIIYRFIWSAQPEGGAMDVVRDETYTGPRGDYEDTLTVPEGVNGKLVVTVTDKRGNVCTEERDFPILPALPFKVSLTLDRATVAVGESVKATGAITGDPAEPFSRSIEFRVREAGKWHYMGSQTPEGGAFELSRAITFGDRLDVVARVRDANGVEVPASQEIPITGSVPNPLTSTAVLSPDQVGHGERLTITHTPTGGKPPYETYAEITLWKAGNQIASYGSSRQGTAYYDVFSDGDTGKAVTYLKDADGRRSDRVTLNFTLKPPTILKGDANKDGKVDVDDLAAIMDHLLTGIPCPSMNNADMDGNSKVDMADALALLQKLVAP